MNSRKKYIDFLEVNGYNREADYIRKYENDWTTNKDYEFSHYFNKAVSSGNLECVKYLFENERDKILDWKTSYTVCSCKSVDVIKYLFDNGYGVLNTNHILEFSTDSNNKDVVSYFLENFYEDVSDQVEQSLNVAIPQCRFNVIPTLIKYVKNEDLIEDLGVYMAFKENKKNVIHFLQTLDRFTRSFVWNCGTTFAQLAIYKGNFDVAKFLLNYEKNINYQDSKFGSYMHAAVLSKKPRMIEIVHEMGGKSNFIDVYGETPLMVAKEIDIKSVLRKIQEIEQKKEC